MKWIDLPPNWLLFCLVLAWAIPIRFTPGPVALFGWVALGLGAVFVVLAVVEFRKARTTIIPRSAPDALITGGIFARSRNPIYLADVLFLLGASMIWGSVAGLVLVPAFAVLLQRRFILGEEGVLRATYGAEYDDYAASVRRWF